jgi:hypothetical protein
VQSRGVLKKTLIRHLRRRRTMRRSKLATTTGQTRGQIIDAVSIRERPPAIEDGAVPGHWEGDLLAGAANSHIATLVERQSRFVLLVRLRGKDTNNVVEALSRTVRALPKGLMSSLTWDRGMELAAHKTSQWRRTSRCTSAIRRALGSVARTRIPTVSSVSTFPTALTYRPSAKPISTLWRGVSTRGPARPWAMTRRLIGWRPALRRPLEPTTAFFARQSE